MTRARAMVRVARHASDADLTKYGVWRIDAAIGFLEATGGPLPKTGRRDVVPQRPERRRATVRRGDPRDEAPGAPGGAKKR